MRDRYVVIELITGKFKLLPLPLERADNGYSIKL